MSLMTVAHHSSVDLNWQSLLSTIVYAVLGVVLLMVFAWIVNSIFRLITKIGRASCRERV